MRRVVSGGFELPTSAEQAINYFTPEGERAWASGWDPVYAEGAASESSGTVFTTNADGVESIWVIRAINRRSYSASYSRVTPGRHAGTVTVRCEDNDDDGCLVTVTYDLSALPDTDPSSLDAYGDASFAAMMDEWSDAITPLL